MGNSPREHNWEAEAEPIMANQSDHASRRQCRLGYFPGGVDQPYGETTDGLETSEGGAVVGESSREFTRRHSSTQATRVEVAGRRRRFGRVGSVFATPDSPSRRGGTNIGEAVAGGELSVTSAMRFPPADLPVQEGEKPRSRTD